MIIVRKMKNGFRCDMCFSKPEYEISGTETGKAYLVSREGFAGGLTILEEGE